MRINIVTVRNQVLVENYKIIKKLLHMAKSQLYGMFWLHIILTIIFDMQIEDKNNNKVYHLSDNHNEYNDI